MRIAIFSDNFHPEIGGIQDSVEALAKALGQRGHSVDFYAPKYGRRDYEPIDAEPGESDLGENVRVRRFLSVPFPSSTRQSRMVIPSPAAWLPLLKGRKPDVIHSQTFFGMGLNALFASRICGVPLVGTNHTAIRAFDSYIRFGMDYVAAYVVWYYNRCDFVTAPSQSVFSEFGPDLRPDREVISNPITTDTFHPVPPAKRAELKAEFGLHGPVVSYAGRLAQEKNIDTTIRALALAKERIPSITLALAGHGAFERPLRELARHLGVEGNVEFLGTLTKPVLARVFQASDIFVTMSTSETQGMTLLQAMACETPAIAANVRALPEYVSDDCGIKLDPFDVNSLSNQIVRLLEDSTLRSTMGRSAGAFARNYSTEVIATRWEQIYRAVARQTANREGKSFEAQLRRTRT